MPTFGGLSGRRVNKTDYKILTTSPLWRNYYINYFRNVPNAGKRIEIA